MPSVHHDIQVCAIGKAIISKRSGSSRADDGEEADTHTAGFVYRPQWLPGFDLSVDWLSVNLTGSIEQFGARDIANACYIQNDPDQCANITLDGVLPPLCAPQTCSA
jgi:hypothetical protein